MSDWCAVCKGVGRVCAGCGQSEEWCVCVSKDGGSFAAFSPVPCPSCSTSPSRSNPVRQLEEAWKSGGGEVDQESFDTAAEFCDTVVEVEKELKQETQPLGALESLPDHLRVFAVRLLASFSSDLPPAVFEAVLKLKSAANSLEIILQAQENQTKKKYRGFHLEPEKPKGSVRT